MASSRSLSSPEAGPRDQSLDLAEAVSSFFSAHPGAATLESILDGHWDPTFTLARPSPTRLPNESAAGPSVPQSSSSNASSASSISPPSSTSSTPATSLVFTPPPAASSSTTTSISVAAKKKNPAGPVAGGLVAALLVLSALAFFLWRAHRRRRNLALTDKENSLAASAPYPFPVDPTPNEATPAQRFSNLPSGETILSPPTQMVPRAILAAEKKAPHTARIEQKIRAFTEQAEGQGGTESIPETSDSPKPDQANAQLLEEIRMLKTQMSAIQQQQIEMQAAIGQGLPEYTADP